MTATLTHRDRLDISKVSVRYAARRAATPKEAYNDADAQQELLQTISATSKTRERANEALGFAAVNMTEEEDVY